jgi:hypothetical protein
VVALTGGYGMIGITTTAGAGNADLLFLRTDASYRVLFQKTYGTAGIELAASITETEDGGFILGGSTLQSSLVLRTGAEGGIDGCAAANVGKDVPASGPGSLSSGTTSAPASSLATTVSDVAAPVARSTTATSYSSEMNDLCTAP